MIPRTHARAARKILVHRRSHLDLVEADRTEGPLELALLEGAVPIQVELGERLGNVGPHRAHGRSLRGRRCLGSSRRTTTPARGDQRDQREKNQKVSRFKPEVECREALCQNARCRLQEQSPPRRLAFTFYLGCLGFAVCWSAQRGATAHLGCARRGTAMRPSVLQLCESCVTVIMRGHTRTNGHYDLHKLSLFERNMGLFVPQPVRG